MFLFQVLAQDYEVAEIECSFGEISSDSNQRINQKLTAKLKKPEGFKGSPIFADERKVDPSVHPECQIRPDEADPKKISYLLKINDLTQCGVLIKNVSYSFVFLIILIRLWVRIPAHPIQEGNGVDSCTNPHSFKKKRKKITVCQMGYAQKS